MGTSRRLILAGLIVLSLISPAASPAQVASFAECGADYFPAGALGVRDPKEDALRRDWYSSHLRAMAEPALWCGKPTGESYRLLWLRTFHHPVSVRIVRTGASVTVTAVELDGAGGYRPGAVARRVEKQLSEHHWSQLKTALTATAFWQLRTTSAQDEVALDGSQWVIEGRAVRRYHVVDRWSPKSGPYRELGIFFLTIAGFVAAGEELY